MSEAPKVHSAIAAITRALGRRGLPKVEVNVDDGYRFRGIDEVIAALSSLLAWHRLCMLPRMLDRGSRTHRAPNGDMMFAILLRAAFDLLSTVDGSRHSIETYGEAIDAGDKGTAKAMSAAFKYAVLQAFCVPVSGADDADVRTPPSLAHDAQVPLEGWRTWSAEIIAIVASCVTHEAIDRVQTRQSERLRTLSKTDAATYAGVGEAVQAKRASLSPLRQREAA